MQRLEVSCAVRLVCTTLGAKGLRKWEVKRVILNYWRRERLPVAMGRGDYDQDKNRKGADLNRHQVLLRRNSVQLEPTEMGAWINGEIHSCWRM